MHLYEAPIPTHKGWKGQKQAIEAKQRLILCIDKDKIEKSLRDYSSLYTKTE